MNRSYTIWIEAEEWAEGQWDIYNDNTDVIVTFEDDSQWIASFFTYKNIDALVEKNIQSGECLNGRYFWSSDMVLIQKCSREQIEEVINHLIEESMFPIIFRRTYPIDLESETPLNGTDWTELSIHFGVIDENYTGDNDEEILAKTKEFLESITHTDREKEIANDVRKFLNLLYENTEGYKDSAYLWKGLLNMEHDFNLIKYTIKLLESMSK